MLMRYRITAHFHRHSGTMGLYQRLNLPFVKVYFRMMKISAPILIATLFLGACSPAPQGVSVHDPYEAQNRRTHAFNKSFSDTLSGPAGDPVRAIPP